ncbi:MAG: hypothetical protein HUJ76_10935 [Parasporobacterium sp.]|nr:hypothetical protein [Parasporobacterium sp.]
MKKKIFGLLSAVLLTMITCMTAYGSQTGAPCNFRVEKVSDYDTGLTLGRCYVPEGYEFVSGLMAYGLSDGWQSPGSPYQLGINIYNKDHETDMLYYSPIQFIYNANGYVPGAVYAGMLRMIPAVSADGFADLLAGHFFGDNDTAKKEGGFMLTQDDDEFLRKRADEMYQLYLLSGGDMAGISFIGAECTYAEQMYSRVEDGQEIITLIVTAVQSCTTEIYQAGGSARYTSMTIPFIYILDTPADLFEDNLADFSLFTANTSMSDEFYAMYLDMVNAYVYVIAIYGNIGLTDIGEEYLSEDYGTYDTESFCEYIMETESYTTSDGQTVKVPASYDYLYEDADGNIILSDSAFGPEGSTKLYRK